MRKPQEHWFKVTIRRVEVLFWAIVAPEMILYWATRQWYGAKKLREKYKGEFSTSSMIIVTNQNNGELDKGWSMTHGYFIQMGGFMLYEGTTPKQVLTAEHMESLLSEGRIIFPDIDEDEIQDRSKGDGLSKFLVIVQTSWFVAQCITRKTQGLITTELELATLAFAVLNGAMYFLWWKKPLNVATAVHVPLLEPLATEVTAVTETLFNQLPSNAVDEKTASKDKNPPNVVITVPVSLHEPQANDDAVAIETLVSKLPFNAVNENPASKEVVDESGRFAGRYIPSSINLQDH
jgi:hypothetical protein